MSPPFLQPSCVLRSRFEAVLEKSEKVKFIQGIKDKVVVVVTGASSGIGERLRLFSLNATQRSYSGGELIPTASTLCGRILSFSSG
jgi:hypothetical protein